MASRVQAGQVFGSLEVIRRAGATPGGAALWLCHCRRCGAECEAEGRRLRAGTQTDCGCRRRDSLIAPGKIYGGIEVLRPSGGKYRTMKRWVVLCSVCGREREMRASSILRNPLSCGCRQYTGETATANGRAAIPRNVRDGIQVYVATKSTPNAGNRHGFRWVRVIHRPNGKGDWIYATFQLQGKKYYRGGFETPESAHAWAADAHAAALRRLGITDPREEREHEI